MRLQTTSLLLCKLSETACEVSNKTGDVRGLFSLICPLWQVLDGYPDTSALGTQMSGVCLSNMSFRVPRRLSHRLWTRLEFKGLDSCLPSSARPGSPGEEDISWVFHGALLGSRTLLGHLEFRFFFSHCWNRINKCTPGQPSTVSFSECVICRAEIYSAGMTLVYEWPRHQNPSHGMFFLTAMETETHRGGANAFVSLLSAWLEHLSLFHVILGIKSILWKLTGAVLLNLCSSRFFLIVDNYYFWVRQ